MLDNGYVYPAGTKLTAYRDDNRWALIIETIGFSYRGGAHNGISNCLHIYGNCLSYEPGTKNENFLHPTNDAPECNTFDEEDYFYLNPKCEKFLLRDKHESIPHDRQLYQDNGIELQDEQRINAFEFLRLLDSIKHERLIATENETRERIPTDIAMILELHEWFHPDVANGELPSANETFQQIAQVLPTGDVQLYRPMEKPNTHWKNWLEGGTL